MIKKLIPICLILTGCGPYYKTDYTFVPPESTSGKRCINGCLTNLQNCELQAQQNYQACLNRARESAQASYAMYLVAQSADKHNKHIQTFDEFNSFRGNNCSELTSICHNSYRECYQNCGGTVDATSVKVNWLGQPID